MGWVLYQLLTLVPLAIIGPPGFIADEFSDISVSRHSLKLVFLFTPKP